MDWLVLPSSNWALPIESAGGTVRGGPDRRARRSPLDDLPQAPQRNTLMEIAILGYGTFYSRDVQTKNPS